MLVVFSAHAAERLKQPRQRGITRSVIRAFAYTIPGHIDKSIALPLPYLGRIFWIVLKDEQAIRLVITVIGKRRR